MGEEFDRTGMYAKERKARPLEAYRMGQLDNIRDFKLLRDSLHNALVVALLETEDAGHALEHRVHAKIAELEQRIESRAGALANERRQFVLAEREKDCWASPSAHGEGWLCIFSPTGVCTYEDPEDTMNDNCDHCGFPEERK